MDTTVNGVESLATAPPPPSEVKVRTLRSDLESMAKSGGGLPRFQNVKVSGLSLEKESSAQVAQTQSKGNVVKIVAIVGGVAVLVVGGWFAYAYFSASGSLVPSSTATPVQPAPAHITQTHSNQAAIPTLTPTPTAPAAPAQTLTPAPVVTPAPPLVHASFFRKPADQTLKFFLSAPGAAMSAADLQTYNQKLATFLDTSSKGAMFVEVDVKEAGGQDLSINDLLSQQGAQVIDAQTLSTNFSADATFFVYRDKNGVWPGYVLSLAQGKDWSIVQASLKNVEASINTSNISAMFLADVGTPSVSGFKDSTIASATAVRTLAFTGGSVPGAFLYGWTLDHRYLILSTSPSGFSAALKRL